MLALGLSSLISRSARKEDIEKELRGAMTICSTYIRHVRGYPRTGSVENTHEGFEVCNFDGAVVGRYLCYFVPLQVSLVDNTCERRVNLMVDDPFTKAHIGMPFSCSTWRTNCRSSAFKALLTFLMTSFHSSRVFLYDAFTFSSTAGRGNDINGAGSDVPIDNTHT